jgi:hypothetical protein
VCTQESRPYIKTAFSVRAQMNVLDDDVVSQGERCLQQALWILPTRAYASVRRAAPVAMRHMKGAAK